MDLRAISAEDVRRAIALHDELGQDEFLRRYGFGPSRSYGLVVDGRTYPSKAIVGVAHEFATGSPLTSAEFNGGRGQTVPVLERLGFAIESDSGQVGDEQAYMLLWNPQNFGWPDDERLAILSETLSGNTFEGRWSISANSSKAKIGDRIYLRKTGARPRGIVASGVVSGSPITASHWGGEDGRAATYVYVEWDAMVDPADVLDLSELAALYPNGPWAARGGGAWIPPEAREALELEWNSHVDGVASSYRASTGAAPSHEKEIQVRYGRAVAKIRRHQRDFRALLLEELPHVCEFPGCGITSIEVLDAAHIDPDSEGGRATLDNGLLLCANHHRAMDRGLMRYVADGEYRWAEGVEPF
ncbi:HNH endonuclease [Brachybacterium paraconglomeratum]